MSRFGQQSSQRLNTGRSYYTTFASGTENPLSESSNWVTGSSFSPIIQKANGIAWGNQTGDEKFVPNFNDSHAFLQGFPPSHRVEVMLNLTRALVTADGDLEVECMLGCKFGAVRNVGTNPGDAFNNQTDFDGIECNLTQGKYGTLGFVSRFLDGTGVTDDFTSAYQAHGVHDGDKLCAELRVDFASSTGIVRMSMIRGTTGVETIIGTTPARTNYFRIGQPGIGFYRENDTQGNANDPTLFCAKAFAARGLY